VKKKKIINNLEKQIKRNKIDKRKLGMKCRRSRERRESEKERKRKKIMNQTSTKFRSKETLDDKSTDPTVYFLFLIFSNSLTFPN
jgi:hypothetical protein